MLVAAVAALVALVMPAAANAVAPSKSDTVQTWTCKWKDAAGVPGNFSASCHESVCIPFTLLSSLFRPPQVPQLTTTTVVLVLRSHTAPRHPRPAGRTERQGCFGNIKDAEEAGGVR